ncbi:MAG: alpha/beta hydrolase [Saprospiraceae bacterium]
MKIPIKMRAMLWLANQKKGSEIHEMSVEQARFSSKTTLDKVAYFFDGPAIPLHQVTDKEIEGRNGLIPIRIYQPIAPNNLPVIMYFHGGGFVMRSIQSHDKVCRRIASQNECIVISVDYRLAPEYKFPMGLHDCYDATVWSVHNATIHKGDPSNLILMGDSAGGNLATAVAMMSRDHNDPKISYQVLIYPCTDGTLSQPSIDTCGEHYYLTKKMMIWFLGHYISKDDDIYSPYLSMMLANDLSNLPPAYILTAEYDPLKDEGKRYADSLRDAGNDVTFKEYGGMIHGFLNMPKMSKYVSIAYSDINRQLSKIKNQSESAD